VILDIRLPGMDGIEVLEKLRALRPTLRVIMLSASTDQELVLEALRLGATDYLAKPLHEEELVLAVQRALETYRMASEWTRLRGRLDRLVTRMQELTAEAAQCAPEDSADVLTEGAAVAASEVLEATKTSLMLLDVDAGLLRVVATVGHGVPVEEMDTVAAGEGVAGIALKRSEPLVVEDVNSDPLFAGFTRTDRYVSDSFAVAPLIGTDGPFGVLCATDRSGGGGFGNEDLSLLRLLALQIADLVRPDARPLQRAAAPVGATPEDDEAALDGIDGAETMLAAQLADALPKTDDDEMDRDAEIARAVCQAVVDEIEPERVMTGALAPICALLPAAPVAIYLLDPSSGELLREVECDGGMGTDHARLPANRGLTGSVVQTGALIATDAPELDPRFDPDVDAPVGGHPRPFLCLPLRLRGKVVGIARAFQQPGTQTSARTGEVLAAALAAAVRNALLYRSLVDTIEEVAEARRAARR
jgi:GAF domain-containing protein